MIRKLAFLTVAFFAVSVPLFCQEGAPAQTAPAQEAQPVVVQPAQTEPSPTNATFESAMKLYRRGRYAAAAEQLEQVVAADSSNAAAWYFLGYAHYVMRHYDKSQEAFAKAFAANPAFDPRPYFRG